MALSLTVSRNANAHRRSADYMRRSVGGIGGTINFGLRPAGRGANIINRGSEVPSRGNS